MNPSYGGGNFGYQGPSQSYMANGSDDSNSGDGNNNATSGQQDILENFPYLRHGFGQALHQPSYTSVSSVSPQQQSMNTNSFKNPYQQSFVQVAGNPLPMNPDMFSQFLGAQNAPQGQLPGMSTFNTSPTQMHQQVVVNPFRNPLELHPANSLSGTWQHLPPIVLPQISSQDPGAVYTSAGTSMNTNIGGITVNSMQLIQTAAVANKPNMQLEYNNQSCDQTAISSSTNPSETTIQNNGFNSPQFSAVKLEPLSIPCIQNPSSIHRAPVIPSNTIPSNMCNKGIVNTETADKQPKKAKMKEQSVSKHYTNGQMTEHTTDMQVKNTHLNKIVIEKVESVTTENGEISHRNIGMNLLDHRKEREEKSACMSENNKGDIITKQRKALGKVRFFLKGKLRQRMDVVLKPVFQILSEPVDFEGRFYEDVVYNFPINPKNKPNIIKEENPSLADSKSNKSRRRKKTAPKPYTEPSIAEIRASAPKATETDIDELEEESRDIDDDQEIREDEYDGDESHANDSVNFGDGSVHENWYSAAMKKYAEISKDLEDVSLSAKKGGRSDPENPFAITSPSFSESAARALMTTTNSATATIVMISIMSIGSRKKLIPKIVNSKAAEGGIVSIVNPIVETRDKQKDSTDDSGDTEGEMKTEKTSIMSKLKREKKEKEEEEAEHVDTDIDRLDINITIDDDQFVSHGDSKRWLCKLCPKSYTTKHNLVAHILDHSNIKPHLCLVCGKYFKQLSHLNTHMLTHDNCKPHKCSVCNKGFTQISHLKRHETVHLESKPYICDICGRGFAYPSELRIHKDKHVPGKEKCVECDTEFGTQKELRDHMLLDKHCNELTCKQCNRVFRFPSQLRDHLMSHVGSRPFMCTECGMDFMKEHHLKAHHFTHSGLQPYACPYCTRAFNQKANMVRHMLIHNSERAFKCDVCSKTFTQPQTLKAHMVVHADKKPYSCKFCSKQFGRLHNLQGHLHIHSDSKPYICSICQSSFTLKGNLNRHKKVKHGLNESTENMEEDAVNFLSSLSDRARDTTGDTDLDMDSRDGMPSPNTKSPKKGRKSTPRKRVSVGSFEENDGGTDMENTSDGENEEQTNMISYSDEERENEERLKELQSQYSVSLDSENRQSKRKRKRDISYKVDNEEELSLDENDNDNDVENGDNNNEEEDKDEVDKINKSDDSETTEPIESTHAEMLREQVQGKRSVRKRKKKDLGEGFTDRDFEEDEEEIQPPTKCRRKKAAMLDTIIAAKFKNV